MILIGFIYDPPLLVLPEALVITEDPHYLQSPVGTEASTSVKCFQCIHVALTQVKMSGR